MRWIWRSVAEMGIGTLQKPQGYGRQSGNRTKRPSTFNNPCGFCELMEAVWVYFSRVIFFTSVKAPAFIR